MEKVFEALEKAAALRQEAADLAKKELGPALQKFLEEHPTIVAIGWRQWIPGFNDGDPCEFTVGAIEFLPLSVAAEHNVDLDDKDAIKDLLQDELEDAFSEESFSIWALKNESKKFNIPAATIKAAEKLEEMLNEAEDILEEVFDSHAEILVTRHGVKVEEYDCGY